MCWSRIHISFLKNNHTIYTLSCYFFFKECNIYIYVNARNSLRSYQTRTFQCIALERKAKSFPVCRMRLIRMIVMTIWIFCSRATPNYIYTWKQITWLHIVMYPNLLSECIILGLHSVGWTSQVRISEWRHLCFGRRHWAATDSIPQVPSCSTPRKAGRMVRCVSTCSTGHN